MVNKRLQDIQNKYTQGDIDSNNFYLNALQTPHPNDSYGDALIQQSQNPNLDTASQIVTSSAGAALKSTANAAKRPNNQYLELAGQASALNSMLDAARSQDDLSTRSNVNFLRNNAGLIDALGNAKEAGDAQASNYYAQKLWRNIQATGMQSTQDPAELIALSGEFTGYNMRTGEFKIRNPMVGMDESINVFAPFQPYIPLAYGDKAAQNDA